MIRLSGRTPLAILGYKNPLDKEGSGPYWISLLRPSPSIVKARRKDLKAKLRLFEGKTRRGTKYWKLGYT